MSILVLAFLTGLPVSGALCAMLCESAPTNSSMSPGHHHGSASNAQTPDHPFTEFRIQGVSEHDCNSHDGRQASTTAAKRADSGVTSIPLVTAVAPATFKALAVSGPYFEYSTLPGSAPPTATPLVLRV